MEAELDKAEADEEEAKAIAGASVLGAHGRTWWSDAGDHLD
jgi:hypothetical protein